MRTSNKILLGTLIAILVVITAINAALYTKYKRNDFSTMKSLREERYDIHDIGEVQSVSLIGLGSVTIVPADTARIEIRKSGFFRVLYQVEKGVLVIKGDSLINKNNNLPERIRSYKDVILYLPSVRNIKADFSDVSIRSMNTNGKRMDSISLELTESSLRLSEDNDHDGRFNKVSITKSSRSSIDVNNVTVMDLMLDLEDSQFEENDMTCDHLQINTDKKSSLKLSGRNIANAKFELKP